MPQVIHKGNADRGGISQLTSINIERSLGQEHLELKFR